MLDTNTDTSTDMQPEPFVDSEGTWESLKVDCNYEINQVYPYFLRKKSKRHRHIRESVNSQGYVVLTVGNKFVRKHNIITSQWKPNTNHMQTIDHINRDPSDNHLDNLQWVSFSDNSRNKRSGRHVTYEYVKELPEGYIEVRRCNGWEFSNLFYKDEVFYTKVNKQYRKLLVLGDTSRHIHAKDIDGNFRAISLNIFQVELDKNLLQN
jgi:hypothetical protein